MFDFLRKFLLKLFGARKELKLGFYGPPNAGKTTLVNRISKDFTGTEIGNVSNIAHETRKVSEKQHVCIQIGNKKMNFAVVDTPGIATKIDYSDFIKAGLKKEEAKKRAEEATKGVIEAIEWLDNIDVIVVVIDATQEPMTQV
ncbi:MAG: GTP-binding protein, partial [Euryarchaeota archaeon HGW-Euryarchaeota-1]